MIINSMIFWGMTLYLRLTFSHCYAGYRLSVASHHICRFSACSGVRFFCFTIRCTSIAHSNSVLPLLFLPSGYQVNYSLRSLVTSPLLYISISFRHVIFHSFHNFLSHLFLIIKSSIGLLTHLYLLYLRTVRATCFDLF